MKQYEIIKYGDLTEYQKKQAASILVKGFGHMMRFTKDESVLERIFYEILNPELFICYVEEGQVLGAIGIATNKVRPVNFSLDVCKKNLGKIKGIMVSKQMNAIFQAPVVKGDRDLYIDFLSTTKKARCKGVATTLLHYAFNLDEYDNYYIEVFSKNEKAFSLYKKVGFSIYEEKKTSLMRFLVPKAGYPIKMKKEDERK